MNLHGARLALVAGTLALLTGCTTEPSYRVARPSPAPAYRPAPPQTAVAAPVSQASGETIWHMRSALNVAALSCRSGPYRQLASNYNQMLRRHRTTLAEAYTQEQAVFRARYGKDWQRRQDSHLTSLYNGFANLATQGPFCATAMTISARVNDMDGAEFREYSRTALAQLERPRASHYLAWD
jgi:hypothetical protein